MRYEVATCPFDTADSAMDELPPICNAVTVFSFRLHVPWQILNQELEMNVLTALIDTRHL